MAIRIFCRSAAVGPVGAAVPPPVVDGVTLVAVAVVVFTAVVAVV